MLEVTAQEREACLATLSVPHGTAGKLDRFAALLTEWNERINLVSASTLPHIWSRHFLDCGQLVKLIPEKSTSLADLGTGAGFPGLVLSILGVPGVTLVEATGKKADFLRTVIEELGLSATVRQDRIESLRDLQTDVVTARALKPLRQLFQLAAPIMKPGATGLFFKGRNLPEELTESLRSWKFHYDKSRSLSDPSGTVLIVRDLHYKHAPARKSRNR